MIYALYPQCNISIHTIWGRQKQNTVYAVGKSILDRSCTTNIGELMLRYGGGGHHAAGTCQIDTPQAAAVLDELIGKINGDHEAAASQRLAV
jgi:nanoRNase/pAp phosphatase (c-di-AMP/oligoRNAs hydrolase)